LRTSGSSRLLKVLAPPHSRRSTASPDRAMCSPREPPVHHCPGNPLLGPSDGPTAVDWTEERRQAQATCQLALTSTRLVCSSEFSRSAVSRCDVAAAAWSSPGIRRSFRVWYPSGIARTGWTTPLRRWPIPSRVVFPRRTSSGRFKASRSFLSSSSAFLPSVLRPILSRRHARQALPRSSPELSSPTAHPSREGPLIAGFACPLRSAFRVWLPS
jgi:hypothetical protein